MHLLSASLGPHVPQRPLLFYLCLCIPLCLLFSAFLPMFLLPSVSSLLLLHLLFSYLHASYASLFLFFPDCLIPHHLSFLSPASISSFPTSCISLFLSSSLPSPLFVRLLPSDSSSATVSIYVVVSFHTYRLSASLLASMLLISLDRPVSTSGALEQSDSLLSCLYLNCPCLSLLSHRLLQFSSGWSSKGSSFFYSVCSKRCC